MPRHQPDEISPEPHHWQLLPGAGFADSYRIALPVALADRGTGEIAARMMTASPAWVVALLELRNRIVAPLGLKGTRLRVGTSQSDGGPPGFPVLADSPGQLIMGIDDSHLDFRLCIEKATVSVPGETPWLTVTTVVRTKRSLGKFYLAAIMPFHRRIVRTLLERLQR